MLGGRIININSIPIQIQCDLGYIAIDGDIAGHHVCPLELLNAITGTVFRIGDTVPEWVLEECLSRSLHKCLLEAYPYAWSHLDRQDNSDWAREYFSYGWMPEAKRISDRRNQYRLQAVPTLPPIPQAWHVPDNYMRRLAYIDHAVYARAIAQTTIGCPMSLTHTVPLRPLQGWIDYQLTKEEWENWRLRNIPCMREKFLQGHDLTPNYHRTTQQRIKKPGRRSHTCQKRPRNYLDPVVDLGVNNYIFTNLAETVKRESSPAIGTRHRAISISSDSDDSSYPSQFAGKRPPPPQFAGKKPPSPEAEESQPPYSSSDDESSSDSDNESSHPQTAGKALPREFAGKTVRNPFQVAGKRPPPEFFAKQLPDDTMDPMDIDHSDSEDTLSSTYSDVTMSKSPSAEFVPESSAEASSAPRKRVRNSKGKGRAFNEKAPLSKAKVRSAKPAPKGRTPAGDIRDEYLFSDVVALQDLSYENLEDMEDLVLADTTWPRTPFGPYYVKIVHCDTSGVDDFVPEHYKRFGFYEDYVGPITGLSDANDRVIITMHERHRTLYELYNPDKELVNAKYREIFDEDGYLKMSAVHEQFFISVTTVKAREVDYQTEIITPHVSMMKDKTLFIIQLVLLGPVRDKVVPSNDPYIKTDVIRVFHNANKWAAGLFKAAAKHLMYEQDIQECILQIRDLVEEAEQECEDEDDFNWKFSHTFDSIHKLPDNEGAGLQTTIQISVKAEQTDKY